MGMGLAGMGFETSAGGAMITKWAGGALTKRFEAAGGDGGTSIPNRSTDAGGGFICDDFGKEPRQKAYSLIGDVP